MESEKKIYIRGNKQYSHLIDAYFEKLGVRNLINDYYTATDHIYYITHDNLVACCNEEYEIAHIIKDHYKEITIDELIKLFEDKEKVKVTLHPFDKVLVRNDTGSKWEAELIVNVSVGNKYYYRCIVSNYKMCVPYNKDTVNLLGTANNCSINYEIEFSKEFKE